MNKLLKDLYDCFYFPPELPAQKQEIEECHQALIEVLEKPERRLAWRISAELNQYEKERSFSRYTAKRSGALSMSGKEETK